jgi:benzoyl-CoA reductase/2-hydroxyglutaryl-CoA dehydratase subunit BcrC/BadD/HgdB
MTMPLQSLTYFSDSYQQRIAQLHDEKAKGMKIVGTFCLFVPDEIIFAAGADRVVLCGGTSETIPVAEQSLPRNICPLVKSSFGSIVDACCGGTLTCPHIPLVDVIVSEATCDAKKKMYEVLEDYVPTYVLDLPQKPDSPEALSYFLSELMKFKAYIEGLTGNRISETALHREILAANETRRLLKRFFDLRKRDPPPIGGTDVLRVMQRQFFLSPPVFREGIWNICHEIEKSSQAPLSGPRIMISGCPLASGNTKVADIIEQNGGVIVAEESCTGTRSFENLVDEQGDPWTALAERYLKIPCACMTPNDRRIADVVDLAKEYNVDGVVYYTLQFCHGYNIERLRVQKALRKEDIPLLAIESDYGNADVEQISVRVNAFMEMIS